MSDELDQAIATARQHLAALIGLAETFRELTAEVHRRHLKSDPRAGEALRSLDAAIAKARSTVAELEAL